MEYWRYHGRYLASVEIEYIRHYIPQNQLPSSAMNSNKSIKKKLLRKFSKSSDNVITSGPGRNSIGSSLGSASTASVNSLISQRNSLGHAQKMVQIIEQAMRDIEYSDTEWECEFRRWKQDWRSKIGDLSFENVLDAVYGETRPHEEYHQFQIDGISVFEMSDDSDTDSYPSELTAVTLPDIPISSNVKGVAVSSGSQFSEIELADMLFEQFQL